MSFADRLGERKKAYKSTTDTTHSRRRREDEAIQIGKREKDDQVARRRRLVEITSDVIEDPSMSSERAIGKGTLPSCLSLYSRRRYN